MAKDYSKSIYTAANFNYLCGINYSIMKKLLFLLCVCALCACEKEQDHQPANPSKWSPVGHKYVSTDVEYPNREITFISKDSILWLRNGSLKTIHYRLDYPILSVFEEELPRLKFIDTLTISRRSDLLDESSCYKLVY